MWFKFGLRSFFIKTFLFICSFCWGHYILCFFFFKISLDALCIKAHYKTINIVSSGPCWFISQSILQLRKKKVLLSIKQCKINWMIQWLSQRQISFLMSDGMEWKILYLASSWKVRQVGDYWTCEVWSYTFNLSPEFWIN